MVLAPILNDMRHEPTFLERQSGEALIADLRQHFVVEDPVFGDRPDLSFMLDSQQVHLEITSLLPAEVHHALKTFFQKLYRNGVSIGRVIVPREPDMWVKAAIERKWASVQKYPHFRSLRNLSLLIHPPGILTDQIDYAEPAFIHALSYGHARSKHGFKNVFYWSGTSIVQFTAPASSVPEVKHDLTDGYPAWVTWSYIRNASGTKVQLEGRTLALHTPDEHTKVVAPMTPQFKGLKPKLPKGDLRLKFGFDKGDVESAGSAQGGAGVVAAPLADLHNGGPQAEAE